MPATRGTRRARSTEACRPAGTVVRSSALDNVSSGVGPVPPHPRRWHDGHMRPIPTIVVGLLIAGGLLLAAASGGPVDRAVRSEVARVPVRRPDPIPVARLMFDDAARAAAAMPRLYSLLVSVDGEVRAEHYFNGATPTRATNIKSASKSIVATLVGIAIDRGHIQGVREPIGRFFPEYLRGSPEKSAITIEDLVTMRSGLETTSNRNYGRWV